MKKILMIFSLLVFFVNAPGQINRYGVPIIRNYPTQMTQGSEQNWCITRDKSGNMYFGNQDRGVIRYDGTHWSSIKIGNNPRIYSLESDTSGIVYVGGAFEFGYIQPGLTGTPEYVSLAARVDSLPEIRFIHNIVVQHDSILFLSPKFIYVYTTRNDSLSRINLKDFNIYSALRLVRINDKLIIADNNEGIFELKGKNVTRLPGGDYFSKKNCTVLLTYDKTKILTGTFFHGLYLYDYVSGVVDSTFISADLNNRLKEVMVYAGAKLDDDLFAIGTTKEEGVLILDKSGELVQRIDNENSGLEDITICSMFDDYKNRSELWISTQGFISKVYFNLPVTQFSEKQGITAGLNSICELKGNLYLSSDAGVYKSYVSDKNTLAFKGIEGAGAQVFPLNIIKSSRGDFLLAGSINGLLQISGNDMVSRVADNFYKGTTKPGDRYNAKKILQSAVNPSIVYIGLDAGGIRIINFDGKRWNYISEIGKIPGYINGMLEKKEGGLWFITEDQNALYSVSFNKTDTLVTKYGPEKGISTEINSIQYIADDLYLATASGVMKYDVPTDKFIKDDSLTGGFSTGKNCMGLFRDADGDIWYSGSDNKNIDMLFRRAGDSINAYSGILKLLPDVNLMDIMYSEGKAYLLKSKSLFVIDKSKLQTDRSKVRTSFIKITAGSDSVVMDGSFYIQDDAGRRVPVLTNPVKKVPEFEYDMNEISFELTTPYYVEELLTEYSCKLEGFERNWSDWEGISFGNTMEAQYFRKRYTNLPYGNYTFKVRTRTLTGLYGNELSYQFIILKPWYLTIWAVMGFMLVAFLIIYLIIKAYTRKLKNENLRLEGIVAERTAVVVKQKDELESSIHYASRIQMALLPSEAILSENIRNYFVLLKPRDIVSGDFYWMTKKGERLYIVAADCTGHGVPGAFMSLLGMSFLDEIIDKDIMLRADEILKDLRLHVTESLKQIGKDNEAKDGMDIALLVIDFSSQKIEFSGAYNPCFKVRKLNGNENEAWLKESKYNDGYMSNGKYLLETIYASKMPIGISSKMNEDFVFHEWALEKGISYYLFSDGYLDQFGGPDGRKFMKKNFKRLILDIQDYPMSKQKELLEQNLKEWMGNSPQIDDILVMGIRTE